MLSIKITRQYVCQSIAYLGRKLPLSDGVANAATQRRRGLKGTAACYEVEGNNEVEEAKIKSHL